MSSLFPVPLKDVLIPPPVLFHVSASRLGASYSVNKTAAQILCRVPRQPPNCEHISHLNYA